MLSRSRRLGHEDGHGTSAADGQQAMIYDDLSLLEFGGLRIGPAYNQFRWCTTGAHCKVSESARACR